MTTSWLRAAAPISGRCPVHRRVLSAKLLTYVSSYNTNLWYEVTRTMDGKTIRGYVLSKLALKRNFQFQKMANAVVALKKEVDNGLTAYISNYKNSNGNPPLHYGSSYDAFGTRRYQSAPAYYAPRSSSDFRYITDGTLVTILGTSGNYYKVRTLNFAGVYYVPQWYVSRRNSIDKLTKVIVVDRKYQNEGVFEYVSGRWNLISYTYATTGENTKYKLPTDLGYYMVISKSSMFIYRDDITKLIAGYAPYVLRFSGGSYVHGVPVNIPSRYIVNGQITYYPPKIEYSSVIGTFPRSHKCVRNYTSHALFLYNWSVLGKTAVIVIE
jgi:hypothetical protein